MSIFSERLRWLRENKGLSQQEIADEIGMSQQGYGKIELGKREPNLDTLTKLPGILGESVDFLLGVTDFTKNSSIIHNHFLDATSNVAILKLDLENININPHSSEIISKDFDPNDPNSIKEKVKRLQKNIPLWVQRMEITRENILKILAGIPMVSEKTIDEITNDSGWVTLFENVTEQNLNKGDQ